MTIAMTMKIKFDPSIVLAFLTCCAQLAASPAQACPAACEASPRCTPVPVIAAGGIGDARGVAAVLALGAQAAWLGARFLLAEEMPIHEDYRRRLIAAAETDPQWYANLYEVGWPDSPHRALRRRRTRETATVGGGHRDRAHLPPVTRAGGARTAAAGAADHPQGRPPKAPPNRMICADTSI